MEEKNFKECFLNFISNNLTEKNVVKITAMAKYFCDEKTKIVQFRETDPEFADSVTTITVTDNSKITIARNGKYSTKINLEKNNPGLSVHSTPFGTYTLTMSLVDFSSSLDSNGGVLRFRYTSEMQFKVVSEIEFEIKVKVKASKN